MVTEQPIAAATMAFSLSPNSSKTSATSLIATPWSHPGQNVYFASFLNVSAILKTCVVIILTPQSAT